MSTQAVSTKHHFIPRFLLKEWKDESEALWIYQRNGRGDISFRKGAPKSVAYVENLYTIYPEYRGAKESTDEIEKEVMAKIDDQAAMVHRKLLDYGVNELTDDERTAWSMFMASMVERSPQRLDRYNDASQLDDYDDDLQGLHPNVAELIERGELNVGAIRNNTVLRFMVERVLDSEFAKLICKMDWFIAQVTTMGEHFVLGDSAAIVNNGTTEEEELYFIRLAISPDKLLILAYNSSRLDLDFVNMLAATYNLLVISRSEKYVISSRELKDEVYTKFNRIIERAHRV